MIVLLFKTSRMYTTTLPLRIKGQYWVSDTDSRGQSRNLFRIEAEGDEWVLKSSRQAWILNEDQNRRETCPLKAGLFLYELVTVIVYSRKYRRSEQKREEQLMRLNRLKKRYEFQDRARELAKEGGRNA